MTADSAPVTARLLTTLREWHEADERQDSSFADADEALKELAMELFGPGKPDPLGDFAAPLAYPPSETREIERLRAENERLANRLHAIACKPHPWTREEIVDFALASLPPDFAGPVPIKQRLTATPEDRNGGA